MRLAGVIRSGVRCATGLLLAGTVNRQAWLSVSSKLLCFAGFVRGTNVRQINAGSSIWDRKTSLRVCAFAG